MQNSEQIFSDTLFSREKVIRENFLIRQVRPALGFHVVLTEKKGIVGTRKYCFLPLVTLQWVSLPKGICHGGGRSSVSKHTSITHTAYLPFLPHSRKSNSKSR